MNNPVSPMIRTKAGVVYHPDTWKIPEMWVIPFVVKMTAPPNYTPTITSGVEGRHSSNSKHYIGKALDFRIRDFPALGLNRWVNEIKKKLGKDYFVLLEKNHIHIHWNG